MARPRKGWSWPHPVIPLRALGASVVFLLAVLPPLGAQPASALVAVAPFADAVTLRHDLAPWASSRLIALLSRKGVPVVPAALAESALLEAGLHAEDLVSLAATEALARRLGADVVITGTLIRADLDHEGTFVPVERPSGPPEALITLRLRLMVVATRRVSFVDVTGHAVGGFLGLTRAIASALQDYADRWPATQP